VPQRAKQKRKRGKKRRKGEEKKEKRGAKERENSKIFSPQSPAALDAQLLLGYHSITAEAFVRSSRRGCSAPAVEKLWLHHCIKGIHWNRIKTATLEAPPCMQTISSTPEGVVPYSGTTNFSLVRTKFHGP
jgi:hypothetical protein